MFENDFQKTVEKNVFFDFQNFEKIKNFENLENSKFSVFEDSLIFLLYISVSDDLVGIHDPTDLRSTISTIRASQNVIEICFRVGKCANTI